MNDAQKAQMILMGQYHQELVKQLAAIEDLLSSPHASLLSPDVVDMVVDDVLRYQGRIADMRKYVTAVAYGTVFESIFHDLITSRLAKNA